MRAKILLLFVFFTTFSFGQRCPWKKCTASLQYQWMKVGVIKHRTIFIDMGGVSSHSTWEIENRTFKKWYPWETKGPRERHVYDIIVDTIKIETLSNDDTGPDHISVYGDGMCIFKSNFGRHENFVLNYDVLATQQLTFEVSGNGTLNNSPGAFEVRIWIKCQVVKWHWKRFKLNRIKPEKNVKQEKSVLALN